MEEKSATFEASLAQVIGGDFPNDSMIKNVTQTIRDCNDIDKTPARDKLVRAALCRLTRENLTMNKAPMKPLSLDLADELASFTNTKSSWHKVAQYLRAASDMMYFARYFEEALGETLPDGEVPRFRKALADIHKCAENHIMTDEIEADLMTTLGAHLTTVKDFFSSKNTHMLNLELESAKDASKTVQIKLAELAYGAFGSKAAWSATLKSTDNEAAIIELATKMNLSDVDADTVKKTILDYDAALSRLACVRDLLGHFVDDAELAASATLIGRARLTLYERSIVDLMTRKPPTLRNDIQKIIKSMRTHQLNEKEHFPTAIFAWLKSVVTGKAPKK